MPAWFDRVLPGVRAEITEADLDLLDRTSREPGDRQATDHHQGSDAHPTRHPPRENSP